MIIGFIGFGKVSRQLVNLISSKDISFATSFENRLNRNIDNVDIYSTYRELSQNSDILISANSPKSALSVAEDYGKYCEGIYLDLNNISPKTTVKINSHVKNLVDGAIIGKIDSINPLIYLSGKCADKLSFLNEFLDVSVISNKIGDASLLKLLRSTYTKTLSVMLIESYNLSRQYNLENEFLDVLSQTEGDEFREKSLSRIKNTLNNKKRKSEEMDEILDFFDSDNLTMVKAAYEKLKQ